MAAGDPCGGPATCGNGVFSGRGTCTGGACAPATPVACAPYRCDGNRCADTCEDDDDCAGNHFCNQNPSPGRCAGDKTLGEACTRPEQCAEGSCVDGVCCESAWDDFPNSACGTNRVCGCTADGCGARTCGSIDDGCGVTVNCPAGSPTPGACSGTTPICSASHVCAACSSERPCPDGGCCQPDGSCVDLGGACSATAVCVAGGVCKLTDGQTCGAGGQCASGFCIDDVCCASAACGPCRACNRPWQEGTCRPRDNGTACDDNDACTAGGVCQAGVCTGGTTVCTNPPTCRTATGATCAAGVCSYPWLAAGAACAAVPCGTCTADGACAPCGLGFECGSNGTCCGLFGSPCGSASDCCPVIDGVGNNLANCPSGACDEREIDQQRPCRSVMPHHRPPVRGRSSR